MAIERRNFKYRLYPTAAQVVTLDAQLAMCCELYNAAMQERRDAWKVQRKSVNFYQQCAQLPGMKEERPDVASVYSEVLKDVLHRVDTTFRAFFGRVRRREKPGYPRFRSVCRYDSLTYSKKAGFWLEGRQLRVSKIGAIKIKLHRPIEGTIKNLTVKREAGRWHAVFCVETQATPLPVSQETVGLDLGVTNFATLDDGVRIRNPRYRRNAQRALRIAARKVARRQLRSHRRRKAVRLLQRSYLHVRSQRANFHHEESRKLVNRYGFIAVENLDVRKLSRGLASRSIADAGWSSFIHNLTYKAADAGRELVKVDPSGTSQVCICGASVPKPWTQRWHLCPECGLCAPRDVVSAQVILQRALRAGTRPSGANVEAVSSCVA